MSEAENQRLVKENNYLRGLIPNVIGKCVHCGLDDMGKCPSGFPGCAWADDLMIANDDIAQSLLSRLREAEAKCERYLKAIGDAYTALNEAGYVAPRFKAREILFTALTPPTDALKGGQS